MPRRWRARWNWPAPLPMHRQLCQKELAAFVDGAAGDVIVACTQEARLFGDVAEEGGKTQTIRFVNIRETGGWSAEAGAATPKIAALLAAAALPEPDPVPRIAFKSEGQLLIAGSGGRGAALGATAARAAGGHRAHHRRRDGQRIAAAARLPGLQRPARQA